MGEQIGPVLACQDLGVSRGGRRLVSHLTFSLFRGECAALVGPNGTGKTSLLRTFAGLLRPAAGTLSRTGPALFLAADPALLGDHTVLENWGFAAGAFGWRGSLGEVTRSLGRAGLGHACSTRVRALSTGQRKRLCLSFAAVLRAPCVLLDEPSSGLDRAGMEFLQELLGEITARNECAVLVATHDEALALRCSATLTLPLAGQGTPPGRLTRKEVLR